MEHLRLRTWVLGLLAVVLLSANVAVAQVLPFENHYQVYTTPPLTFTKPILLTDQFGPIQASVFYLERWSNPTTKIIPETGDQFPPVDPVIHQSWWRMVPPPAQPPKPIVGIDQFGTAPWTLYDPVYLLNPSLKNVPGGSPPIWNHYVCYEAAGPIIDRPVILIDQWGTANVVVLHGRYFCNPVEKRHLDDGRVYPILDYKAHLACYVVQNTLPQGHAVNAIDQFGYWQFDVIQQDCLCVPALKEHVVRTEESTWGRIKALYQ